MTRAQTARLATGVIGTIATGIAASLVDGIGWIVTTIFVGFVVSSILSERAFRALADTEEQRRDLEERVRADD